MADSSAPSVLPTATEAGGSTTVDEVAKLRESLASAQAEVANMKAQAWNVPASTLPSLSGNTDSPGNTDVQMADPDLQALCLEWGDFDPQMIKQMLSDRALKQTFIAARTLQPEVTQSVEGNKLAKRDNKRVRPDDSGSLLLQNVDWPIPQRQQ